MVLAAPLSSAHAGAFLFAPGVVNQASSYSSSSSSKNNFTGEAENVHLLQPILNTNPNPSIGGGNITVVDQSALIGTGGASESVDSSRGVNTGADQKYGGQVSIYVVREGDTISGIANLFNVSENTIRWANSIAKGSSIHTGETLVILPITGIEHTVQKGDTIKSIAKKYNADYKEVLFYNNLSTSDTLKAGSTVIIPNGEVAPAHAKNTSTQSGSSATKAKTVRGVEKQSAPSNGYFIEPLKHYVKTQGIHDHNAVDLAAPTGTNIYAAASGVVIVSHNDGGWNGGYGNYVVIKHPNGEQTLYAHMSNDIVKYGQRVVQGQVIGYVGNTGESTGPHLHVEVHGGANPF
jgi:murein DD-endopeptidase MepM/ murein hydrolase activator NlpD